MFFFYTVYVLYVTIFDELANAKKKKTIPKNNNNKANKKQYTTFVTCTLVRGKKNCPGQTSNLWCNITNHSAMEKYISYLFMCRCEGYGFQTVSLAWDRV